MPEPLGYIRKWFCELQTSSDTPVTYQEIDAWSRLTSQVPTPGEAQFLRELSFLYVRILSTPA